MQGMDLNLSMGSKHAKTSDPHYRLGQETKYSS